MHACFEGRQETVKLLLEWGADPNMLSGSTWAHRPLHRVVEHQGRNAKTRRPPQDPAHSLWTTERIRCGGQPSHR